jgi:hypothetical protein
MKYYDTEYVEEANQRKTRERKKRDYISLCRDTKRHKNGQDLNFMDYKDFNRR